MDVEGSGQVVAVARNDSDYLMFCWIEERGTAGV